MEPNSFHQTNDESYPFKTFDKVRYSDTDRQGHVNNAVFAAFCETGRVEFLYDPINPLHDEGAAFVIAQLNISFKNEICWPGTIEIGTAVEKIGTSSIQLIQGLFQDGKMVGAATSVIVQVDETTKKAKPLSARRKEKLASYLIKE